MSAVQPEDHEAQRTPMWRVERDTQGNVIDQRVVIVVTPPVTTGQDVWMGGRNR